MKEKKSITVAVIGHGTVGSAVCAVLYEQSKQLYARTGVNIEIKHIVVRTIPSIPKLQSLFTKDLDRVLQDPAVDCIVELIGGTSIAFTIAAQALLNGKDVVTANKALLAYRGGELLALARKQKRVIAFEASCGGGIPIIRALVDGLLANTIDAIFGIVNGTCNYILSNMASKGISYTEALQQAQEHGMAEMDSSLDISGLDSGHKIAIMASLAFGLKVDFEKIHIQGIENIDLADVVYSKTLGYEIKLLAAAIRIKQGVCVWVRPAFIDKKHPLAWVENSFNAVSVYGSINGHSLYYGRGAGGIPTASAVISDIISIAMGTTQNIFRATRYWQDLNTWTEQVPVQHTWNRYYLRVPVWDRPGVLADLANILAEHSISIASILQDEIPEEQLGNEQQTNIIIITHTASEMQIINAIQAINSLEFVYMQCRCIIIAEEHEEVIIKH